MTFNQIDGYPGYFVSKNGHVASIKSGYFKIMKPNKSPNGYWKLSLSIDGTIKTESIHRLVAKTFLKDRNECINHKDGDKNNNQISNLEWVSQKENIKHAYFSGLNIKAKGDLNSFAKLKTKDVLKIKSLIKKGLGCSHIAKIFNVHRCTISSIKFKKSWNHL